MKPIAFVDEMGIHYLCNGISQQGRGRTGEEAGQCEGEET